MKHLFFILLLFPLLTAAQSPGPKFKNDTLYTAGGYKIYNGRILEFGKGTDKKGNFKFLTIKNGIDETKLSDNSLTVNGLKNFGVSADEDGYIGITGTIVYKDNTKATVDLVIFFDKAIEDSVGVQPELIVPAEFRNNYPIVLYNGFKKLLNLYIEGKIDQATYEAEKKELLKQ